MGSLLDAFTSSDLFGEAVHRGKEDYQEAQQDTLNSRKRIHDVLDKKAIELLEEYESDNLQRLFFYGSDHFQYGFRLGVLLMAEVFADKEQMVKDADSL